MGVAGLAMAAVMPSRRLNAFSAALLRARCLWLRHFLEALEAFLAPGGRDKGRYRQRARAHFIGLMPIGCRP